MSRNLIRKEFLFKELPPRRKFWLSQTKPKVQELCWQPKLICEMMAPIPTQSFDKKKGPYVPYFVDILCQKCSFSTQNSKKVTWTEHNYGC